MTLTRYIFLTSLLFITGFVFGQSFQIKGKILDESLKPLPFASVKVQHPEMNLICKEDGTFSINLPEYINEVTLSASHVGKSSQTITVTKAQSGKEQIILLNAQSLKLPDIEVNGVRKTTSGSNSSILFNREAIEQSQPLSLVNVLNYLPGHTVLKPNVSIQGVQPIILRASLPANSVEALNNAFGVSLMVDGGSVSNAANMQALNPNFMGFFSSNNISHPENSFIQDRSRRNGSLYSTYGSLTANNGLDLRQIPAENIESVEVISGVASARYGEYTTGVVNVIRQAGITPIRGSIRINDATQNLGLNHGFSVGSMGALNFSVDYLNSKDDPRNKLKAYQRVGGSVIWTYQERKAQLFKNTFSIDYQTTLDKTNLDPDEGRMRTAHFDNKNLRLGNRTEWMIKNKWLYSIRLQGNLSYSKQEAYEQYWMNSASVIAVADGMETGTYEGHFAPGYYLAVKHIVDEPLTASARLETNSVFKFSSEGVYKLTLGANFNYNENKGAGVLIDPDRPRFDDQGYKNDRPRPYRNVPVQRNMGVYMENNLSSVVFDKPFTINAGLRGDFQNSFFTLSPRLNASIRLNPWLNWKLAYGIATQSPSLSQLSPGNTYIDIPLLKLYNGFAAQSLYLVHTEVIPGFNNQELKPYRSYTFETGVSIDAKPFHGSLFVFNRISNNGFSSQPQLLILNLPVYEATIVPDQKPTWAASGRDTTYFASYSKISNGSYTVSRGAELMLGTEKINAIQTSFTFNTAFYYSIFRNLNESIQIDRNNIDYSKPGLFGTFEASESRSSSLKSTLVSTTHIPSLRMAVMLTGEIFWTNRQKSMPSEIYPVGYYDFNGVHHRLTEEQRTSAEFAYLHKNLTSGAVRYTPNFVYTNLHLRLSKEIGESLRFSFNAYNAFNIRPKERSATGISYYNGMPSFGAELIFSINKKK